MLLHFLCTLARPGRAFRNHATSGGLISVGRAPSRSLTHSLTLARSFIIRAKNYTLPEGDASVTKEKVQLQIANNNFALNDCNHKDSFAKAGRKKGKVQLHTQYSSTHPDISFPRGPWEL